MTMIYSTTLDPVTYTQQLKDLIKAVEGETFAPYVDITGNPTIGWGFALNDAHITTSAVLTDIIEKVLGVNKGRVGFSSTAKASENAFENLLKATLNATWPVDLTGHHTGSSIDLNIALNAILAKRAADIANATNGYTAADRVAIGVPATTFGYSTVDQISATFDIIKPEIDRRLNTALGMTVPNTTERMALFAMTFLGAMGPKMKGLLKTAFSQSDTSDARAQAWYAIRYQNKAGWEQRSYVEAAMFGLYNDNNNVTVADAKAVYRMLTLHRDEILAYDSAHTAALANADVTVKSATGGTVGALATAQALNPAKPILLADLIVQNPGIPALQDALAADMDTNFTNDRFLSTDIYLGNANTCNVLTVQNDAAGNPVTRDSILIGDSGADVLNGGQGNDVLIGGTGNDYLTGGKGNDLMLGGAGDDTYIINTGDGTDTIEDKLGNNRVILNGKPIGLLIRQADGTMTSPDGLITAHMRGTDLVIKEIPSGIETILNKDFQEGDFGIHFQDAPTDPTAPQTTYDIVGDPLIHTATIAPGSEGADWVVIKTYNLLNDDQGHLISYSADYYLVDANRNPTEGGQQARDDTLLHDTAGNDHFMSGAGNDTITLNQGGDDIVDTGAGDDTVTITKGGNDVINLGAGDDNLITYYSATGNLTVNGGDGRDYLGAGSGRDLIEGGAGADNLYGSSENDRLYGDTKIDTATAIDQGETQQGSGQQGEWVDAEDGNDLVVTGAGNDLIAGGAGDDLIVTGAGNDVIYGDLNIYHDGDQWKNWVVTETASSTGYSYSFQNIYTESDEGVGDDTLYAGAGDDVAFGQRGNDTLYMGAGNDKAWGGEGNDILIGGAGDDKLFGDADTIYGSGDNEAANDSEWRVAA